jgi:hypothetical protein
MFLFFFFCLLFDYCVLFNYFVIIIDLYFRVGILVSPIVLVRGVCFHIYYNIFSYCYMFFFSFEILQLEECIFILDITFKERRMLKMLLSPNRMFAYPRGLFVFFINVCEVNHSLLFISSFSSHFQFLNRLL